ncbi:MAG: hypothetical protein DSM106950_05465 [Stigonema ocellatum SAG 48.90 = DSM 106950]|nr:hypothetical protein [Stigonema ocellatum SAG 48.90 = DSM 106950]
MTNNINSSETISNHSWVKANTKAKGFIFVIAMWLVSRLLIIVAIQILTPLHNTSPTHPDWEPPNPLDFLPSFVPKPGWELFSHWDGKWYKRIATVGYDYANDGQQHSVAFFPIFPLLIRFVMMLGLPFDVAGTLVNNLAFLGAMLILYQWAQERHGISAARWVTAVLAWCPLSIYGTVIYTEGVYLLITTAALRAFDNRQYAWAAFWGALASATRATGITLLPTFLLTAWRERRPPIAYVAGLATGLGLLLFSIYCGIRFADPLAFVHVQKAWTQTPWSDILRDAVTLGRDGVTKVVMVFGGGYLLWRLRSSLSNVAVAFGFCSLAMIIASKATFSVHRYAYGIVSLPLALGLLFSRHPRWGYAIVGWFAILLYYYASGFARWDWVA